MFVGHLGVGFILNSRRRQIKLGTLFFCVMLLDLVLWGLVLLGVEEIIFPAGMKSMAEVTFRFPYSHGLLASALWSLLAAFIMFAKRKDPGASLIVGFAVFSHFILDWLVHIPELPLAGAESTRIGLGLWRNLPLAWTIEVSITLLGIIVFLRRNPLSKARTVALLAGIGFLMAMTILGQASSGPPPPPAIMATSSLVMILVVISFGSWVTKEPVPEPAREAINTG